MSLIAHDTSWQKTANLDYIQQIFPSPSSTNTSFIYDEAFRGHRKGCVSRRHWPSSWYGDWYGGICILRLICVAENVRTNQVRLSAYQSPQEGDDPARVFFIRTLGHLFKYSISAPELDAVPIAIAMPRRPNYSSAGSPGALADCICREEHTRVFQENKKSPKSR